MQVWISTGAALFIFAGAASAGPAGQPIKLSMAWNLSMDAQGHVTQLAAVPNKRGDRVPQIRDRLEGAIREWRFIPGAVNGQAAPTDTLLSITVELEPRGADSYRIIVDDARTGGRIAKTKAPRYPTSAVRNHETGMVVLRVDYDATGTVTAAKLEAGAPRSVDSLAKAAVEAAKAWTFQPEQVGNQGVAGTSVVPICFAMFTVRPRESDLVGCEWTPPGRRAAIGEGEAYAVNPAARLQTDIAGHAL